MLSMVYVSAIPKMLRAPTNMAWNYVLEGALSCALRIDVQSKRKIVSLHLALGYVLNVICFPE